MGTTNIYIGNAGVSSEWQTIGVGTAQTQRFDAPERAQRQQQTLRRQQLGLAEVTRFRTELAELRTLVGLLVSSPRTIYSLASERLSASAIRE